MVVKGEGRVEELRKALFFHEEDEGKKKWWWRDLFLRVQRALYSDEHLPRLG